MNYQSTVRSESQSFPGVWFEIKRLSLSGRLELLRLVRREGRDLEFHSASDEMADQLRAREIAASIQAIYIRWGLDRIEGLCIDGEAANRDSLLDKGPEALCTEIAEAIRSECFLSETERKN
jgi:hypothetical protein